MKIPYGYGQINIKFPGSSQPDGVPRTIIMNVDSDTSNYEPIEFSDKWLSLARSKEKDIYGYHFNWDLTLIDEDLIGSSNQDDLANFLYYYYRSTSKDKAFYIIPYYSSADNYATWIAQNIDKALFTVITREEPKLENFVSNTRAKGQKLSLKIETKFMLPKDSYNYLVYRDTTDDNWGTLPTSGTPTLGASSASSQGRPSGSVVANMITSSTDRNFETGSIGNWVVYTDGDGTVIYQADEPAAGDKTAKIRVGATPGTYTGMSLPTSAITTFVNGKTYRIRALVNILSTANNFTKFSLLPTNMAGWTKVSETTATLTTEDAWQRIEATYTAAADVTGEITVKGESVTGGDIFYADNLEIYEVLY